ncbi:MAG TPA: hypothetical protein VNM67_01685 [Thermoanaerobaculia bacterium]|jgi:hypothetical protein|nr:hypothetical protein [Thermoanaerobaculia bacterium]
MKRTLLTGLFMLGAMSFAVSAQQIRANFQGKCSAVGNNISCIFDASKPANDPSRCPNGAAPLWYAWEFGDAQFSDLQSQPVIQHTYTNQWAYYLPYVEIFCEPHDNQEDYAQLTRPLCVTYSQGGCIYVTGSFN